jgi:hypothetical protein
MRHADALALLDRETTRARRAIAVERWVVAFAPLAAFAAVWMAAALLGAVERLGPYPEALAACAFWVVGLGPLVWGARRFKAPSLKEARARLARDSGVEAATLNALEDQPTKLDPISLALWRQSQADARARTQRLRAAPAKLDLAGVDPWRLRFLAPGALLLAFAFAQDAGPDRLARALFPDPGVLAGDAPLTIEAWAAPAAYTGGAAVSLGDRIGQAIETPPSIEVTVRASGPRGAPVLVFDGAAGRREALLVKAADGAWEAKLKIPGAGDLRLVRFHTKARWQLRPGQDAVPQIAFTSPPPANPAKRIAFGWSGSDDFGVETVALRLTPVTPPPGLVGAAPIDTPIPVPAAGPEAIGEADLLLYDHPYAGMEVEARLVAKDALAQEGLSAPVRFTLPEKAFSQPAALAAVEIRKVILHERRRYAEGLAIPDLSLTRPVDEGGLYPEDNSPNLTRAPRAIQRAARMLDAMTLLPDAASFPDFGVWSGLRLARNALGLARNSEGTVRAGDILWQVALFAEYGDGADARQALEAARDRLAQALKDGASQDVIQQRMEELKQAVRDHIEALTQEALASGQTPQSQDDALAEEGLSPQDLDRMMQAMQRMADAGQLNEAEKMLQDLSQLLGNLSVKLGDGPGLAQSDTRGTQAQGDQTAKGIADAIGAQRALRDQTAGEGGAGPDPTGKGEGADGQAGANGKGGQGEGQGKSDGQGKGGDGPSQLAERQGALGDMIAARRGAMKGGRASEALGDAESAMREAESALRDGDMAKAADRQSEALRRLRQGLERHRQDRAGRGGDGQSQTSGGPRDPLGRAMGGAGEGEETAVPEEVERQRARDIRDEVRKRAQDPRRPEQEREYLRRLLDRFDGS